jgi:hypothetical protein
MGHTVVDLIHAVGRLVDALLATDRIQPKGVPGRFKVTGTKPGGKGREIVGTIFAQGKTLPGQLVVVGDGDVYATGDEYEATGSGDPTNPNWRLGIRLKSQNPPRGANLYAALPSPDVSTIPTDNGLQVIVGLATEENHNSLTGANGESLAMIRVFPQLIVPGSYSAYSDHLTNVIVQSKAVAAENWRSTLSQPVTPSRPIAISLAGPIGEGEVALAVTLPADVALADCLPGFYVHWRIDGEVMIGKLVTTTLLVILAAGGRGAEGTTAAAHATGAQTQLLTGMATVEAIEPGIETSVRVAFVTGYGVAGPPSVTNVLTTWRRFVIPALTTGQFTVEMRQNGYHLTWERPWDPAQLPAHVPVTAGPGGSESGSWTASETKA